MLAHKCQSPLDSRQPTITTPTHCVELSDGVLQGTSCHSSVLGALQALDLSRQQDDFQYSRRVLQSLEVDVDAISRDVHQMQQEVSVNTARGDVREACGPDVSLEGCSCCNIDHWPQQHVLAC